MRVLVVEDNLKLGSVLRRLFEDEAMSHAIVTNARAALEEMQTATYDVLVLDWMLPDMDGVTLCAELRRSGSRVPILMLTARGELRDKIVGFESGVDDYLVKPFDVEELLLRLRALVRRSPVAKTTRGDLVIDRMARRATLRGAPLDLTARELALLLHLVDAEGRTATKTEILEKVWDLTFDPGTNVIEVLISRLRDKLGSESGLIETVRGVGYRIRSETSLARSVAQVGLHRRRNPGKHRIERYSARPVSGSVRGHAPREISRCCRSLHLVLPRRRRLR